MSTDFTVIIPIRQHFGDQQGYFDDVEPNVPFAGDYKFFYFDCPDVGRGGPALLMFQSRDVDHANNRFYINGRDIYGGIPVSPNKNAWNGNVMLYSELLVEKDNYMLIQSRDANGQPEGEGGGIDDFIIDNMVILYKTK